jgi:predicted transcriptional regulator of viral defense system
LNVVVSRVTFSPQQLFVRAAAKADKRLGVRDVREISKTQCHRTFVFGSDCTTGRLGCVRIGRVVIVIVAAGDEGQQRQRE